jgi:hypothetical protein
MAAASRLSNSDLRQMGVKDPSKFWPVMLSRDGKTAYLWEEMGPGQREGGVLSRLWQFRYASDGSLIDSRVYPLAMPRAQQMCLTPDERGVVLLARLGASFWYLDLDSGDLREFVTPGLGRTRFISDPMALWVDQGKLYTVGYTLDAEGYSGPHTVAQILPDQTGEKAIVPSSCDIDAVLAKFDRWYVQRWVNPTLGFAAGKKGALYEMAAWKAGVGLTSIGRYEDITSLWANGTKVFFTADTPEGSSVAVLYDAANGRRWEAPKTNRVYDYPMVSEDGETVTLTVTDKGGTTMDVLYGRASEDFQLKPVPGLTKTALGTIRLAGDGRSLVLRNADGLFRVGLP